ncbi:hypothetical protein EGM88_15630 [Aureibaculum marinum]|uniref:TonB C-terminal domain-containing protein n=1 Tax=Aureibaculum marinum TaxID=2487930 RepID=A0A3N4N888_9FLAO|nr:hypothetical protein [Aureibaculum marinum]RPD90377.1 hypothetical protein EGM88_15630 [Aureibaculum marinum]
MKSKKILFALFLFSIIQISNGQVTPIEKIVDSKKTTYLTNHHSDYISSVEAQSYEVKLKLQEELKINDNIHPLFIKNCLNQNTYSSLKNHKVIFIIEYVCDENGDVLSCSLINYGNKVSVSNSEVECILTAAMNSNFDFNAPSSIGQFKVRIMKHFKFKN